jgi:histidinol-phosphate aminotransferase
MDNFLFQINARPYLHKYSTERDGGTDAIFLDANESYRQWVKLDFSRIQNLHRYPDDSSKVLRVALCEKYLKGFSPEELIIGAGSMELIDLILRCFCKIGLLVNEPSYQVYETKALQNGTEISKVPLCKDFSVNTHALQTSAHTADVLLFINPNNPTGTLVPSATLEEVLSFFRGLVVVDEAYIEFAGLQHSLISFVKSHPNVIVLRSFSKAWGLAGVRLGYAVASPAIISRLMALKNTYNVPVLSQEAGVQALEQRDGLTAFVQECLNVKRHLLSKLLERSIKATDTHANFILLKIANSKKLHQHLKDNGVLVRHRGYMPLLENTIRISVGDVHENTKLLKLVENFVEMQQLVAN